MALVIFSFFYCRATGYSGRSNGPKQHERTYKSERLEWQRLGSDYYVFRGMIWDMIQGQSQERCDVATMPIEWSCRWLSQRRVFFRRNMASHMRVWCETKSQCCMDVRLADGHDVCWYCARPYTKSFDVQQGAETALLDVCSRKSRPRYPGRERERQGTKETRRWFKLDRLA